MPSKGGWRVWVGFGVLVLVPLALLLLFGSEQRQDPRFNEEFAPGASANAALNVKHSVRFTNALLYFGFLGLAFVVVGLGWAALAALWKIEMRLARLEARLGDGKPEAVEAKGRTVREVLTALGLLEKPSALPKAPPGQIAVPGAVASPALPAVGPAPQPAAEVPGGLDGPRPGEPIEAWAERVQKEDERRFRGGR